MQRKLFSTILMLLLMPFYASANSLGFHLTDNKKKPLVNAVVYLLPLSAKTPNTPPKKVTINQRNKKFLPHVSVFQKGTVATFLNQDPVKHHVYSFSKPKKFEIKLYSGKPPRTITFDRTGLVTLGCNIHDEMIAYTFVVDTPYHALSNAKGRAVLNGVPKGQYVLKIEHPLQKKGIQQRINLPVNPNHFSYQLALKPQWKKRKKRNSSYDPFEADSNY